jgi:hypothetical protein
MPTSAQVLEAIPANSQKAVTGEFPWERLKHAQNQDAPSQNTPFALLSRRQIA